MNEYGALVENLSHCHFVHHKLTWSGLWLSLNLQGKRSATNNVSHGMATEDSSPLSVIKKYDLSTFCNYWFKATALKSLTNFQTATFWKILFLVTQLWHRKASKEWAQKSSHWHNWLVFSNAQWHPPPEWQGLIQIPTPLVPGILSSQREYNSQIIMLDHHTPSSSGTNITAKVYHSPFVATGYFVVFRLLLLPR
jgi:hypothetical protein